MKPIHKFNNGIGATLCNECSKIITEGFTEDLYCEEHGGERRYTYKLVRERDNLTKNGFNIGWVEWDEMSRGKRIHNQLEVGYSLVLDFAFGNYTWLTTPITEIIENKDNYIKFKTENSVYELFKTPSIS